ncbi:ornithine cyclodeaminase family protein [Schizosaccharomyces cryophilus OY26]|uniref:Ornithine cyclodeaminase family protein n=1 Tax=Schizosaccharomyces cryophilus (strain OY26 / ATCC MYA-4695 / CBS 11777 / NBRC 106824 / NRRL Y48691) TaxID=653667 RepID=S9W4X1_SCHCR|nr:ornithine cyclodeaminase family protein [Schizosaccharomyces cryophilus OY26]EPY52970.1 ornithine cyclodeaminase family protein [Schizosaccharomyces cryophilus OY26]
MNNKLSSPTIFLSREALISYLPWDALIDALRDIFTKPVECPPRLHYPIKSSVDENEVHNTLLIMPCWSPGEYIGVKQNLPSLFSHYLLSDANTGTHLAQLDGGELTSRRTAAASALASTYLSRNDAASLVILGSGKVARSLIYAHCSVRPIQTISIWNHRNENAVALIESICHDFPSIQLHAIRNEDLEDVVKVCDIISCATLSTSPIVKGSWIQPGTHVDLVGGFTPNMHEADSACVSKASVFVDTRAGALSEAGDLLTPVKEGVFSIDDVQADLFDLCNKHHKGRAHLTDPRSAITLFKSVGDSREDLAAASLAYNTHMNRNL